jgi:hypothetical protein
MMQIIHCLFCNGSHIPLDGVSVNVNFTRHNYCEKCRNSHDEVRNFFFCSPECLDKYIQREMLKGKPVFQWFEYDQVFGQCAEPLSLQK